MTDATALRHAMSHLATGVTVITTRRPDGSPAGTTANAVTSLSLAPPQLLVCLTRDSATLHAIRTHGAFAVNILAEHQHRISMNFARRGTTASWHGVKHDVGALSPAIRDALTTLQCRVDRTLDGGDHEIVIGTVDALDVSVRPAPPLLFWCGAYASLTTIE